MGGKKGREEGNGGTGTETFSVQRYWGVKVDSLYFLVADPSFLLSGPDVTGSPRCMESIV